MISKVITNLDIKATISLKMELFVHPDLLRIAMVTISLHFEYEITNY